MNIEEIDAQYQPQAAPVDIGAIDAKYVPDTSGNPVVPEGQTWETAGGKITGGRVDPGFVKKLELLTAGTHRGVTNFTLGLMSKLPLGEKYQQRIKEADTTIENIREANKKKYTGAYSDIGEVIGEMIVTAPAGGLLGGIMKAGKAVAAAVPLLKGAAKYSTIGAGTVGTNALIESQRYDPSKPGSLFNTEAAMDVIKHPATAAVMGMAGAKFGDWLGASRALGKAKELDPYTVAADIRDPLISMAGKQAQQLENIGDVVGNFVKKASARPTENMNAEDLFNYASKHVKGSLKVLDANNTLMWEKPFKAKPIAAPEEVKKIAINAIGLIKNSGIPAEELSIRSLKKMMEHPGTMTVEEAKKIASLIGKARKNTLSVDTAGVGLDMVQDLSDLQDDVLGQIQKSLSGDDFKDFMAAKAHTLRYNNFKNSVPIVKKAITDEIAAQNLTSQLIGTKRQFRSMKPMYEQMGEKGHNAIVTAKVAQAMESSMTEGHFDLGKFLNKSAVFSNDLKGTDVYKSLEGLNAHLLKVNDKNKGGGWKLPSMASAAAVVAPIAAGTILSGGVGAGVALVSLLATKLVANYSPLKYIMHAFTKKMPDGTYEQLRKAAEKHFTRLGLILTDDGVLKHNKEE